MKKWDRSVGFIFFFPEKKKNYKSPTTAAMTAAPARLEENLKVPAAAPVNGCAEEVGFADELPELAVLLVTVIPPVPLLIVSR